MTRRSKNAAQVYRALPTSAQRVIRELLNAMSNASRERTGDGASASELESIIGKIERVLYDIKAKR